MIKILIADDNTDKLQNIRKYIFEGLNISEEDIIIASDITNAKREMKDKKFDLLILDIQLPLRFDQKPEIDGGLHLLADIKRNNQKFHVPSNIIGLSQFDSSIEKVEQEFGSHLHALVKYDPSSDEWIRRIKNQIQHIQDVNSSEETKLHQYDMGIIFALKTELDMFLSIKQNWEEKKFDSDDTTYYTRIFKTTNKDLKIVAAHASQMGMNAAIVLTMKVASHFKPIYICMGGIMAGVKGSVQLGDIVIADPSWDYDSGKYNEVNGELEFLPDPLPLRLDRDLASAIQSACDNEAMLQGIKSKWMGNKPSTTLNALIGAAASGAAVLAHPEKIREVQKRSRKLKGIDMESYGVMFAAVNGIKPRPTAFTVKSISDFADTNKNDLYQPYAAYTSAMFIHFLIDNYMIFD